MNDPSRPCAVIRPLLASAVMSALCLTLLACGGGDQGASDGSQKRTPDAPALATQVPLPTSTAQAVAVLKSANPSATTSASTAASDGVSPDVHAFIVGVAASDTQRSTLFKAARAMQAVLSVDLSRQPDLQTVVNDLAKARACLRAQWAAESDASWNALSTRTFDTLFRRLKQAAFLVVSRFLTKPPTDVACSPMPPATGGETGGGTVPPPPPPTPSTPPSVAQQLGAEIVRLEQQGVLPTLDRSTDLRGPDTNGNGIRDDIDAYIALLALTGPQKKAASQRARSQQSKLLVDPSDAKAVQNLSIQSIAATSCMGDVFVGEDASQANELALRIAAITANTPERAQRYIRFMAALSGTSVQYPSGNTCEE